MKHNLRKAMLHKLNNLPIETTRLINKKIHENLFNSKLWKKSRLIGITLSNGAEWDTYKIIERAFQENKKICVPDTNEATYSMKFYLIDSLKDLKIGNYDLYEPIDISVDKFCDKYQIDLMIVPGLVFDEKGYRIGFGGGYFDRYLKDFKNVTVSLLAEFQIIKQIPTNQYDISVNYLITEKSIVETS